MNQQSKVSTEQSQKAEPAKFVEIIKGKRRRKHHSNSTHNHNHLSQTQLDELVLRDIRYLEAPEISAVKSEEG